MDGMENNRVFPNLQHELKEIFSMLNFLIKDFVYDICRLVFFGMSSTMSQIILHL
jgi:hypothetical protein